MNDEKSEFEKHSDPRYDITVKYRPWMKPLKGSLAVGALLAALTSLTYLVLGDKEDESALIKPPPSAVEILRAEMSGQPVPEYFPEPSSAAPDPAPVTEGSRAPASVETIETVEIEPAIKRLKFNKKGLKVSKNLSKKKVLAFFSKKMKKKPECLTISTSESGHLTAKVMLSKNGSVKKVSTPTGDEKALHKCLKVLVGKNNKSLQSKNKKDSEVTLSFSVI
ncbi:MAG: hypothetical protein AB7F86_13265 [Bdellovibrionales bacterium]